MTDENLLAQVIKLTDENTRLYSRNKELEMENRVLRDRIDAVKDFIRTAEGAARP